MGSFPVGISTVDKQITEENTSIFAANSDFRCTANVQIKKLSNYVEEKVNFFLCSQGVVRICTQRASNVPQLQMKNEKPLYTKLFIRSTTYLGIFCCNLISSCESQCGYRDKTFTTDKATNMVGVKKVLKEN